MSIFMTSTINKYFLNGSIALCVQLDGILREPHNIYIDIANIQFAIQQNVAWSAPRCLYLVIDACRSDHVPLLCKQIDIRHAPKDLIFFLMTSWHGTAFRVRRFDGSQNKLVNTRVFSDLTSLWCNLHKWPCYLWKTMRSIEMTS